MKHARSDYDCIQDMAPAIALAQLVLEMGMVTPNGIASRDLARQVLDSAGINADSTAIVTNGTVRIIPKDEPVFLLRGQDRHAAETVRHWANQAEAYGADKDIVRVARAHADLMDAWPKKKRPDLPAES